MRFGLLGKASTSSTVVLCIGKELHIHVIDLVRRAVVPAP